MYGGVRQCLRRGVRGAIIYGHTRWGKTYGIRYCSRLLKQDLPRVVVLTVSSPRNPPRSEGGFFGVLLESAQHARPDTGSGFRLRRRLYNRYSELVANASGNTLVLFVDEAQRLEILHYEWLRDVQDKLGERGIRMFVFLVGQPGILNSRSAFCSDVDTSQIVSRFMVDVMPFSGLRAAADLKMPLDAYDRSAFPEDSDWTYTRFFLPRAFDAGFRLGDQMQVVWNTFEAVHRLGRFDFPLEIPMEYLARSVELALSTNMEHDGSCFALSGACWEQAIAESNFVAALQALRIIFVDQAN
ncbi:ATP-binding protein [Paraburkholderia youngii]|uniref:ATP-binding protein n=1 Tax=Paraburkholderia youngii TaxID=2782701 RepID=UPI003D1E6695